MTEQEQRIAIAEVCGWKRILRPKEDDLGPIGKLMEVRWINPNPKEGEVKFRFSCPQYLHDLNAMHEAEKILNKSQQREYLYHLFGTQRRDDEDLYKAVTITSQQKAKAFLKTIGKWKD